MIAADTEVETFLNYEVSAAKGGDLPFYPGTASIYQRDRDTAKVVVTDVRGSEKDFSLDHHGFEFHDHVSAEKDFTSDERVKSIVYDEAIKLLKEETGATRVYPFSHIIRRQLFEKALDIAKTAEPSQTLPFIVPARYVHVDQSYVGAQEVLRDNMPSQADQLSKTRWGIINVWRPISPIRRDPFAACDASTVAEEDLVGKRAMLPGKGTGTFENVSSGQSFETWGAYSDPKHKWYYQSNMTPEEVMFVKCYDSKKDGRARRTPHSAFVDPKTKDDPRPRESIEVRCLVFWEDQEVE